MAQAVRYEGIYQIYSKQLPEKDQGNPSRTTDANLDRVFVTNTLIFIDLKVGTQAPPAPIPDEVVKTIHILS